ncbi:MAG TPA: MlaD family protein [Terracidiphilus sp.]|nr:MlaD family protein [Terracidiphilus sp.]
MPSRKEIKWSQLKVGALVLAAMAILVLLIFLMSGSTGGLFARKLTLRSYFDNASGLKTGAPVTLEGVTIGNVTSIRVVPSRNPTPVEVVMTVGLEYLHDLHTDSTTSIAQAGVLGDSFVDIDSTQAVGPPPANNTELKATQSPNIQSVISSSQVGISEVTELMRKLSVLIDTLNSQKGTIGELINNRDFYSKVLRITDNLDKITGDLSQGQGSMGKLLKDDTLYNHANSAIEHLDNVTAGLDEGKGSAGKLLHDDTFYNNLNQTVANLNQLTGEINAGKGSIGKLAKDPTFARKLDETLTRLDSILTSVDQGNGTIGQLVKNRTLYDHTDNAMDQAQQLLKAIRQDPKKYFVIRLKMF